MTLNQTWRNCLRMWKWIAKVWKKDGPTVNDLKRKWLRKYRFEAIMENCFFCEYTIVNDDNGDCDFCPGKLVRKRFNCSTKRYNYYIKPVKFYEELLILDAKRKKRMILK